MLPSATWEATARLHQQENLDKPRLILSRSSIFAHFDLSEKRSVFLTFSKAPEFTGRSAEKIDPGKVLNVPDLLVLSEKLTVFLTFS